LTNFDRNTCHVFSHGQRSVKVIASQSKEIYYEFIETSLCEQLIEVWHRWYWGLGVAEDIGPAISQASDGPISEKVSFILFFLFFLLGYGRGCYLNGELLRERRIGIRIRRIYATAQVKAISS